MTDPAPATPDEAVEEPEGGPVDAFALALDIDSWDEAVDLAERSVPNLRSIGWELRKLGDGMDWRSAYLNLLESWSAVCEMTGIEGDSSPEEVVQVLSRRQGDTVAARVGCTHCCENGHVDADDMVTMEMDAYGRGFDDGAEGRTRFASLEDPTVAGLATVRVGDVARRLHEDRRDSHEGVGTSCPRCMDDARWLLGVGADGAGDGR